MNERWPGAAVALHWLSAALVVGLLLVEGVVAMGEHSRKGER